MADYLSSYLKVLPDYEADSLRAALLEENKEINAAHVNISEYENIINNLETLADMITEVLPVTPNIDKVSRDAFNKFHLDVYLDVQRLYKSSELIESALKNYEYFHKNEIHNLQLAIDALNKRINEIDSNAQTKETIITLIEDFSTNHASSMELRPEFEYLYKDRDGSTGFKADIKTEGTKSRLTTIERANHDLLRDDTGKLTAKIVVTDKRGEPVPQTQHPIEYALDSNMSTYWGEMVLTDSEIKTAMTEGKYIIPEGGALSRIEITLSKIEHISEIVIHPFSPFPLRVSAMFYKDIEDNTIPIVGSDGYVASGEVDVIKNYVVGKKDAEIVNHTIPASMIGGKSYNVSITVKNTGQTSWTEAEMYRLGAAGDSDPLSADTRYILDPNESIEPGQSKTFNFIMKAPNDAMTYTTDWRMLCEHVEWFGQTLVTQVKVTPSTTNNDKAAANTSNIQIVQCNGVRTNKIILYMRQDSYTNNTYLVAENMSAAMWDNLKGKEYELTYKKFDTGSLVNVQLEQDTVDIIDGWKKVGLSNDIITKYVPSNTGAWYTHISDYQIPNRYYWDSSGDPSVQVSSPETIKYNGYYYNVVYLEGTPEETANILKQSTDYYGIYTDNQGKQYIYVKAYSDLHDHFFVGH